MPAAAGMLWGEPQIGQKIKQNCDLIIAHTLPESGLGEAINDRLRRAAVKIIGYL